MKIGYYPGKHIKNNVVSFLEAHAKRQPDKVAFYFLSKSKLGSDKLNHDSMTYSDFNSKVGSVAGSLSSLGIRQNDRMIVFVPISPELYISIAALQRIGAIPVLLDSWSRQEQLMAIVKNSTPLGIIASSTWLQAYETHLNHLKIKMKISSDKDSSARIVAKLSDLFSGRSKEIISVKQDHTALITYTTGSSGTPKGVNRTHRFLAAQHYALKRLFPYDSNDVDLPIFPVFALNNIASGITTVIPAINISKSSAEDSKVLLTQISKMKVNSMTLDPSSFRNLAIYCKEKGIFLNGISRVLTGGAPISETDIARFIHIAPNSKNWILYGSTEVEPIAYIESRKMLSIKQPKGKNVSEIGVNVGKIDKALRYKLINIETKDFYQAVNIRDLEVGMGQVGELIVAGEHVCQGYYRNKEAFARAKIKDKSGIIWHRTGDLARIDRNRYLWIVGRKHNVIESNGKYFFPVRPEIILKDLPYIANAAYLDFRHRHRHRIVAVVSLKNDDEKVRAKSRMEIAKIFEKEKLPLDEIVFMKEIPMDVRHHSKVDYNTLRQKLYELYA